MTSIFVQINDHVVDRLDLVAHAVGRPRAFVAGELIEAAITACLPLAPTEPDEPDEPDGDWPPTPAA